MRKETRELDLHVYLRYLGVGKLNVWLTSPNWFPWIDFCHIWIYRIRRSLDLRILNWRANYPWPAVGYRKRSTRMSPHLADLLWLPRFSLKWNFELIWLRTFWRFVFTRKQEIKVNGKCSTWRYSWTANNEQTKRAPRILNTQQRELYSVHFLAGSFIKAKRCENIFHYYSFLFFFNQTHVFFLGFVSLCFWANVVCMWSNGTLYKTHTNLQVH